MKVVITGGTHKADYIIGMFNNNNNELIIVNSNIDTCRYLSEKNGLQIVNADPSKPHKLKEAGSNDADLLIALSDDDIENYVVCKIGKQLLNVKKCIAIVSNPKNVELFKKLGIDSVVSSTYLLAEHIKNESSIKDIIKTLSIEDNKIIMVEIVMDEKYKLCNKKLYELNMSSYASISCIYRGSNAIIPNGNTELLANDKVFVVTTKENEEKLIKAFKER